MDSKIKALPKISLHDHLDGGLRPQTMIELADSVGHKLPHTPPPPNSVIGFSNRLTQGP